MLTKVEEYFYNFCNQTFEDHHRYPHFGHSELNKVVIHLNSTWEKTLQSLL